MPLSLSTLSIRSSMSADQAVLFVHQLIAKLPYESLIKLLACVSTHGSSNVFPIQWLIERNLWSPKGPWVKRQEDGWLDAIRKPTLKTSTSASFHQSFIGGQSLSIVSNLNTGKSRLGVDGLASLDCWPDG